MRIAAHEPKPIDEHRALRREGVDKICKMLAFNRAIIL
jgi:hypothetical protein